MTDADRQICEFENPLILLTDRKISSINDLVPVLEAVQKSGSPLLILAEEVEGEALQPLLRTGTAVCCGWQPYGPLLRRTPQGRSGRHRRADRRNPDQ